jgi:hypothetical protein
MDIFMWDGAKRENQQQYQRLLGRMVESYQLVGAAEQLEDEHISCWWKLGRAWKFYDRLAIPESEALDRVLHADAAAD